MHPFLAAVATVFLAFPPIAAAGSAQDWTGVEILGLRLGNRSVEDIVSSSPGLRLPGKRYVMIEELEGPVLVEAGPLTVGDLVVKFDGQSVSSVEEIEKILAGLTLPKDIRIDFLDIIQGTKPKTKRESVTIRAKKPPSKPAKTSPATPPSSSPSNPYGDPGSDPDPGSGGKRPAPPSAANPGVTVNYDRFKDETFMEIPDRPVEDAKYAPPRFDVSAGAYFPGERWSVRPTVMFVITSRSEDWRFLETDRTLYLIIDDGKPITLEKPHYANRIMDAPYFCWEYLSWSMSEELIAKLTVARKVECKVSIVEFRLPSGFGSSLAEFDRKLRSLGKTDAAPVAP